MASSEAWPVPDLCWGGDSGLWCAAVLFLHQTSKSVCKPNQEIGFSAGGHEPTLQLLHYKQGF